VGCGLVVSRVSIRSKTDFLLLIFRHGCVNELFYCFRESSAA
jgi:hypothetical protein